MASFVIYDTESLVVRSIASNELPHTREMREAACPPGCSALWTRDDLGPHTPDRDKLHFPTPGDPRLRVDRIPLTEEEIAAARSYEDQIDVWREAHKLVTEESRRATAVHLAASEPNPALKAAFLRIADGATLSIE